MRVSLQPERVAVVAAAEALLDRDLVDLSAEDAWQAMQWTLLPMLDAVGMSHDMAQGSLAGLGLGPSAREELVARPDISTQLLERLGRSDHHQVVRRASLARLTQQRPTHPITEMPS